MTAQRNPTTLIALAAVTLVLATTSFAQTAKNYSRGTINVTPANVSTTTLNGVINSVSSTAIVNITAPNVTVTTFSGGTINAGATTGTASSVPITIGTWTGSATSGQGGNVRVRTTANVTISALGANPVRTLTVSGGSLSLPGALTVSGTFTMSGGSISGGSISANKFALTAGTIGASLTGSSALRKTGTGTLTLNGAANTYSGTTTVTAGTLVIGSASGLPAGQALTVNGGTLNLGGTSATVGTVTVSRGTISNGTVSSDTAYNVSGGTISANLTGAAALTKTGAGQVVLSGTNTYSGSTTVRAGTLQGNTLSLDGPITNNASLVFDQATDGEYTGVIAGTGRLTKTGVGKLTLSGLNTYRGVTRVSGGILAVTASNIQGAIVNNARLEFTEELLGTFNGNISGIGQLTKLGAGVLTLGGANTYTGNTTVSDGTLAGSTRSLRGDIALANNSVVNFEQSTTGTYAGRMSGTGVLRKTGLGALTITGVNSYTGGTFVQEGTLIGNANSLQGDILNTAFVTFSQSGTGTYAGVMSGTGSLTKAGGGTLILSGENDYTGGTRVNAGTLQGDTVSLQGEIENNGAVAFNESGTGVYSGSMSGRGALRMIGAGTLTLSANNNYTGATTVSAGSLYVEGNQQSATGSVTVASGATLGGKGIIGGATTINGGIHLIGQSAADDAAGIQTFSRSLTYRPGSEVFWRLTDNTTDIGAEGAYTYDRANIGTSFVASNAQAFTFDMSFNSTGSTVDWNDPFWGQEYTGAAGWLVYDATRLSITGALAPTSTLLDSQDVELSSVRPGYSFAFYGDNANGDIYLNYIYSP
jgi:autotransporter-associated beta strand protein